jgi:hypothetical protein
VLLLPYDVGNLSTGSLPMETIWQVVRDRQPVCDALGSSLHRQFVFALWQVYGIIATMIVIILPWTIFYYESYDVDHFGDEVR